MSESSVRKSGNPFEVQVRDTQRLKGLSSLEEQAAVSADIAALGRDGYLILEGLLSPDKVAEVGTDMDRLHQATPLGITDFEGFHTKRIYNLMAKARSVDALCSHPRILAIIEGYLQNQIQLSSATGITLLPDETSQGLHRDDSVYPLPRPQPPLMVGTLWAIDAYTTANGGTELIPGSHSTSEEHVPDERPMNIVMPAGSVLLLDGGLWHGDGANTTDQQRRAISLSYCCAWLRQQENAYLSIPLETVRSLSRPMQCLLGYTTASIMLGQVERRNPIHWFDETA
jgi:ectoine hydroxylase-related dioxygenase (phytanoyl-CoA dioxygenase family)